MFGMKCCDYKCNKCNHEWIDSKQSGFEKAAYEYSGCPECKSKDCSWSPHEMEPMNEERESAFQNKLHAPGRLGKPPKDFVEMLGKMKKKHQGYKENKSSINADW